MELVNYKHLNISQVDISAISVLICASGYESRCTYIAERFETDCEKYAICFDSYKRNKQRKLNDKFFHENGFKFVNVKQDFTPIIDLIDNILMRYANKTCTIVFDYSSMQREWYASVLHYLNLTSTYNNTVKLLFCYSFSKYDPPHEVKSYYRYIEPLDGYVNFAIPDKPTALLLGLGYEKGRAYGLKEFLDAETFIFYTHSEEGNEKFSSDVERQNREIFANLPVDHIFKYTISNLEHTTNLLYSVCSDLIDDYRIVLAPCGPKPFTLSCLITAIKLDDIDVWRISTGIDKIYKREANGKVLILECLFK